MRSVKWCEAARVKCDAGEVKLYPVNSIVVSYIQRRDIFIENDKKL